MMVLKVDEVEDAMRRARREPDNFKRLMILFRQAPTRDPRIAVGVGEIMMRSVRFSETWEDSRYILRRYYIEGDDEPAAWWAANEADLRRRARQLPR